MKSIIIACTIVVSAAAAGAEDLHNRLAPQERSGGWKLLFDGQSLAGWKGTGGAAPACWKVVDGELRVVPGASGTGDLITETAYSDFELSWEWKIAAGGNSGVKYLLVDQAKSLGPEYQLLDDQLHPDAKAHGGSRTSGALYDVIVPSAGKKLLPPGEWNRSRLLVKGTHVEHWLNGVMTVSYELGSEALKARIAESKFAAVAGWGERKTSPILLQYHGNEIAFRDLKIRVIQ